MKDFTNKVAAITGAGSGMGRTLALNLAARGCHLALSDVNTQGLDETVAQLKSFEVKVTADKLDVADRVLERENRYLVRRLLEYLRIKLKRAPESDRADEEGSEKLVHCDGLIAL